jgi:hypothetical protein
MILCVDLCYVLTVLRENSSYLTTCWIQVCSRQIWHVFCQPLPVHHQTGDQREFIPTSYVAVAAPLEGDDDWQVNTGGDTIHAKRIPRHFRTIKWLSAAIWLPFFFSPYLRWEDRQAVLFDIENSPFHLFCATVHPDDILVSAVVSVTHFVSGSKVMKSHSKRLRIPGAESLAYRAGPVFSCLTSPAVH